MLFFKNNYEEEINNLKKVIADKDELLKYKDRTSEYMKEIIDIIKTHKHDPCISHYMMDNFIQVMMLEYKSFNNKQNPVDDIDKLEREIKSLKFKLSNAEKKNKSLLNHKSIDDRFELIQKIYSDIDKFIQDEEDVFERRVESSLVHSKILEDGYMFDKSSKKMRSNVSMILKALYGYQYLINLPSAQEIEDLVADIDKIETDREYGFIRSKQYNIESFLEKNNDCLHDVKRALSDFTLKNDKYIKLAADATLCELFRKFTLRSIKMNSKVKLMLETIKDSLIILNENYDKELTDLSIENKKLKDNLSQLLSDDKDKIIRELQQELASLRVENEALRYKKGGN